MTPTAPAQASILVVEDEAQQLHPFVQLLELRGFSVMTASNGTDAIAITKRELPDLVVVDLLLIARGDELDGFDVIRDIRACEATRRVYILAWSAHYIRPQDEIRALRVGADMFANKDSEYGVLEARIEALLRRATL